jgi:hypothetical protein
MNEDALAAVYAFEAEGLVVPAPNYPPLAKLSAVFGFDLPAFTLERFRLFTLEKLQDPADRIVQEVVQLTRRIFEGVTSMLSEGPAAARRLHDLVFEKFSSRRPFSEGDLAIQNQVDAFLRAATSEEHRKAFALLAKTFVFERSDSLQRAVDAGLLRAYACPEFTAR